MSRQKAATRSRRENKRTSRKEQRSGVHRDNVMILPGFGDIDTIGMAREKRDERVLSPRNEIQRQYMNAIKHQNLIFATGEAGCGKTFLSTAMAADALINKDIERIIVTRPVLQADEDLGFLPGDIAEKFAPYFRPVYDVLVKRLGASFLQYCLRPEIGKVEIAPFAYMRGRTFENAFVILDEAQNVTVNQMKLFLTRMGENVTVVVNGDITQCDLPSHINSGLADALIRFEANNQIGVIKFTQEDCVRSTLCQHVLAAYTN
ncbi:PhoH-like ATP-binding protein [Proteus vulgaris]|uniref:phosphate starvation-inducible protein PhoH n=1 Tax=Proteus TaxID=583 RepID=UPI000657B399|nr:phosphate starvation-inducible protein PhoH [Proteus vulgaris]WIF70425.1 phosphate starvation-inducible protein PhoH [Proteus vulgaris]CRL59883.1 PhoH-like protein [Proteus vulgaris]SUC01160.1 PhoH-like ATP-binding protein [Proteus vulgaris]